ncbi:hypothetical protein GSUB_01020 [Geoalkalibacter subterraneus]|uniref:Uncharacterized protein n=1 Tax=Geoalkalibacter subterraneus TaxID=483547 RepID=A0A0B5FPB3_9BACT|nr:hypothetical protein GSUB_01020 [Geoalkalibacter subterraneus]
MSSRFPVFSSQVAKMGGENVAQLKIRLSEGPQQASIFDRLPAKCQSRRFQDEFDREHRKCPGFVIFCHLLFGRPLAYP